MRPGARLRLDSVSKAWGAVLILQLAGESKLRLEDTVERWLPGLLPDGDRITIRELLDHTSGLIDSNDLAPDPLRFLRRVHDARLRARLTSLVHRQATHPTAPMSPRLWVDLAAAVPLRSTPGTTFHYSNIGYIIVTMLAEKVGGAPIATLVRRRISRPLNLTSVGYQPQGAIAGPHLREYNRDVSGRFRDATGWHRQGQALDGGIVASPGDEGRFLTALMRGRLLRRAQLTALKSTTAASDGYALGFSVVGTACGEIAFQHNGASYATASSVFVSEDGRRVAVVAVNGNAMGSAYRLDPRVTERVRAAAERLFCAA
jgi:D-alanyl-D-alanine carboxypeptidase